MYEAVPSGGGPTIITPSRCNQLLMYDADGEEDDMTEDYYVECEMTPSPNRKLQPHHHNVRTRLPGASPAHTYNTPCDSHNVDIDAEPRNNLVHLSERDRAHRADNNNALTNANEHQLLTNANNNHISERIIAPDTFGINERHNTTPDNHVQPQKKSKAFEVVVMEDSKDLNERIDNNGNGHPHPEDWIQRNGITQRHSELNQKKIENDNCVGVNMVDRVDVEQIKLERYKLKTQNVGVQTTHLSPYRLRFWPVAASIKCLDASFMDVVKCCLRTLSQWFLSQVGLTCVLIVWALLGATAFYKTEGPREREQAEQIDHYKVDISIDMATDLRQLKEGSDKWPETIQKYLNKHENLLLQAVSSGYVEGGGSIWTYPGCVLFAVLLLTTLGFGAPVPRTSLGRGMAVLFSAVGIPLHFMLIINASSLIAKCLRNLATIKPAGEMHEAKTKRRFWYKWFPPVVAVLYYIMGVIGFGVLRQRGVVECLMFALDFTESGGVANTAGHVRILYALYIEIAVILAATIMSIVQVSATNGIIDLGLRLGLLTNT